MFGSAMGLGFTALGLASGLWAAATARFMMPNVVTEPPNRFKVGLPGDYPPGFVETKYKERFGVWVVHGVYRGKRQIYALRTVCTHLGCITIWQPGEQRFKCPCHGSGFYADGHQFRGSRPAPAGALRHPPRRRRATGGRQKDERSEKNSASGTTRRAMWKDER